MTKKQPKEKRIEEIIQAAVSEFLEKGYEGTTIDSIANRAGLTKGGVYHHFAGKEHILRAANDLFQEPIDQLAKRAMAHPSALAGLREFVRGYVEHWAHHPREIAFVFLTLSKTMAVREAWPAMHTYYEQALVDYAGQLERAVEQGELKPHDTKARALALMSALDGITQYLATATPRPDFHAVAQQLENALFQDLVVEQRPTPED